MDGFWNKFYQEANIMKFTVSDECIGCGLCEGTCPEVFEMEDGVAHAIEGDVDPAVEDTAQEALDGCPVGAISAE